MISHLELSTMIGTFARSGSVASIWRKRAIASLPSIRSASMLTSRMLAPFCACSRATAMAAS